MNKVKNVKKEEIFKLLSEGKEVYAINPRNDCLINLKYENANYVLKCMKSEELVFFVVESEDQINGN